MQNIQNKQMSDEEIFKALDINQPNNAQPSNIQQKPTAQNKQISDEEIFKALDIQQPSTQQISAQQSNNAQPNIAQQQLPSQNQQIQQAQQPSILKKVAGYIFNPLSDPFVRLGADVVAGGLKGAEGAINFPHNLVEDLKRYGVNAYNGDIPHIQPKDYGQMLGMQEPSMVDKIIQGLVQYALPTAPVKAEKLLSPLGLAMRGAISGGTQSDTPISGAAIGAGTGALGGLAATALKGGTNLAKGIYNALIGRGKIEEGNLLNELSGGLHASTDTPIESASKDVAAYIKDLKDNREQISDTGYNTIKNQFGNDEIDSKYLPSADEIKSKLTPNLQDVHDQFVENPTYSNAFKLRSDIGKTISNLNRQSKMGALSSIDNDKLPILYKAKNILTNDLTNFLDEKGNADIDLDSSTLQNLNLNSNGFTWKDLLRNTNEYYKNKIVTFRESPILFKISEGIDKNPAQAVSNIFKAPEESMEDITNDLPQDALNKMLYTAIYNGKKASGDTLEDTLNNYYALDRKKLGSYITPDVKQRFDMLQKYYTQLQSSKKLGKYLIPAGIAGALGAGYTAKNIMDKK